MKTDNIIELEPGARCLVAIAFHIKPDPILHPKNNHMGCCLCADWLELICEASQIDCGPVALAGQCVFNRAVYVIETSALNELLAAVKARLARVAKGSLLKSVSIGWCYVSENTYRMWHPREGSDTDFNALLSAEAIHAGIANSTETVAVVQQLNAAIERGASEEERRPLLEKLINLMGEREE